MKFERKDRRTEAERRFDDLLDELANGSTTFEDASDLLKLLKGRKELYEKKHKVSPDTMAVIAGNLLGILLILGYEKTDIITSKALGFVLKGRI